MAERGPPPRRLSGTELDEAKRSLVAMFGERLAEQPHRARIEQIDELLATIDKFRGRAVFLSSEEFFACPPEALFDTKQTVRGAEKWYVDFDRCLPFFNETNGCAICIAVCPWSRPGVGMNLAEKLSRRRNRLAAEGNT